ncbi:hypothetical protein AAU61_01490 [Desulfocarbo indianensis]|nr:hypothetical protein AAU61_01490 [Desulfocarbo indianensis]
MDQAWRKALVRWLEGSKAEQTPLALFLEGAWRPVELLGEELRQGPQATGGRRRRFVLRCGGSYYFLENSDENAVWRFRPFKKGLED